MKKIEMHKFLTFPRSFGKQCFAVIDALYSKRQSGLILNSTPENRL